MGPLSNRIQTVVSGAGSLEVRLGFIGLAGLVPYVYALSLSDLRQHTRGFLTAFFLAFLLYALATWLVVRARQASRLGLALISAFAVVYLGLMVSTPPTLSDDMYRYVWDGRVQAHRINPYAHPPSAAQLVFLRDEAVWPWINRKESVTVYPAGAQLAFAALWRAWPDSVRWFQIAMAGGALVAGLLLFPLLRALGRPTQRVLVFLWSPLVIYETAHAAHVDGLVLPLLVGAWLARARKHDALTGALLGAAASLKLYPALLLPPLWRPRDDEGRLRPAWTMPLAFGAVFLTTYLPYRSLGIGVIGFLPDYFQDRFNMGLAAALTRVIELIGGRPQLVVSGLVMAILAGISLALVLRPARNAEEAIRRCIWPIGAFTLLTQNLFPWYMLWLVPLLALFVGPEPANGDSDVPASWLSNAWNAWFLFSGLVALAYTFFISWKPVPWALGVQFLPLYALLFLSGLDLWRRRHEARGT